MNKTNLLKLADFLEHNVADEQFDMSNYRQDSWGVSSDFVSLTDCGTVGCALGWAPFVAPEFEPKPEDFYGEELHWYDYAKRIFGLTRKEFSWCFSGSWDRVDNTRHGAAKRIRYLVKNGTPDDFNGLANPILMRLYQ